MKRFGTSWSSKSWGFLRRHRLQQAFGADDFHHPFQVVGEHIQAHLRTHPVQLSGQEVRCAHPLLERPEGMLNIKRGC